MVFLKKEIKSSTAWIIIAAAVVLLFGGALSWAYYNEPNDYDYSNGGTLTQQKTEVDETADWKTYTNDTYGFSFKYPKDWENTKTEATSEPALGDLATDLVFKVKFYDLLNQKQIDCANNELQNWTSKTPTKTECEPILSELTKVQKENLTGPKSPQNIYIRIWKKNDAVALKDWLYNKFHKSNTELEKYQVGKEINIASLSGYYSSIGCCAQSDRNYVVEKNGYVYSLGTNYFKDSITDTEMPAIFTLISKTLKLTTPASTTAATVSNTTTTTAVAWKTYENTDYGFGLTFTDAWEGYKMKAVDLEGTVKTFYVNVPTSDPLYVSETSTAYAGYAAPFAISVIEKSKWQDDELFARDFGSKVGEKGDYVFTSSQGQACVTDLCGGDIMSSVKTVMDSFTVL